MAQPPYDPYGYGSQDPYAQSYSQPPAVQHHYYGASMPVAPPTNGMATASLVCGLIGFFACGVTSVLAVIFGHVSLSQIKRTGEGGHGMAVTGLILGYLISAGWLLILLFYILGIAMFAASTGSTY
ncbi:DUF4190 domain-containing protein [Actinomadura geliboluensis]|jgi:hypothetical protein|uniref:DUF4190 domain-containing protein n=1 Tax=Actinomadura geliboluensis TaxID=882440 RepID=A0A5S4H5V6_9ACTN|nr:DUF4190 domain-containing protein [Actinomadura geliboluensis]TMR40332.1 DUF4190 domain-containing protein [Actinomadura geliboluensis]